ncbi:MAG: hypothetical protein GWP05_09440 [Anaerolineaceae bacterium]|nr:hypothetical protein [Anaerolineaceae bacterium]
MQVAAQPSNNIYTLLMLIALVFLLVTVAFVMVEADSRFGWWIPFADQYEKAKQVNKRDSTRIEKIIADSQDALEKVTLKNPESEEATATP